MTTYYRIVHEYLGEEYTFRPVNVYEETDVKDITEVCFSKTIEGCLFAINMFLEEGYYFIYKTTEEPCTDLSNSSLIDFASIEEVRYRRPIKCEYYGKIDVSSFLIHCLNGLYEDSNYAGFNNRTAKEGLKRFVEVREEVVLAN